MSARRRVCDHAGCQKTARWSLHLDLKAPIGEDGWLRFCAQHAAFVTGDDIFEDPQATLEPDDGYPWLQGVR